LPQKCPQRAAARKRQGNLEFGQNSKLAAVMNKAEFACTSGPCVYE